MLQERLLRPILGIQDVRTDTRIDFVGGAKGTQTLEQMVDSGRMAVAFSMYPVSMVELMEVSDAGADHAAEVDVVRAETSRWVADS